jgi:hypothetical protein
MNHPVGVSTGGANGKNVIEGGIGGNADPLRRLHLYRSTSESMQEIDIPGGKSYGISTARNIVTSRATP